MNEYSSDEFAHYGVKGMKWGVRKKRGRKSYPNSSKDYARSAKLSRKKMHELSNDDIRFLNNRLELENNYLKKRKDREGLGKRFLNQVKDKSISTLSTAVVSVGTALALTYASKSPRFGGYIPKVKSKNK